MYTSTTTTKTPNYLPKERNVSPAKNIKKPLLKSTLSSNSVLSTYSPQLSTSSNTPSLETNTPTYMTSVSYSPNVAEEITIKNLNLSSSSNKLNSSPVAYQAMTSNALPSFYATVSSTSVNNSTGAATSILSTPLSISHFNSSSSNLININNSTTTNNNNYYNNNNFSENEKNDLIKFKLENFELKTTVGTGTFGRVICVKHKQTKEYYALKIMSIAEVLRLKQTEHVKNEKEILNLVTHPFIIKLYWTYHNEKFLYMLCEYVCGGELFSYLRNAVKFSNETANFYAAEIVSAIEYLHSLSIIYRDLKPENLLLDRDGHIRICDFGFAKKVYDRTWTLCGTPEYLAPEIIQGKGHHKAVDWWALGILIFEMLAGYPPFYDENPFQIYQKILAGKIEWPKYLDLVAKDLIKKLLVSDRTKRLGTMKNGADDVKNHKWFKNIEWASVAQKKLIPPIVPKVNHDGDTSRFDRYEEEGWKDVPAVPSKNLEPFEDF